MMIDFAYRRSVDPTYNARLRPIRLIRHFCLQGDGQIHPALLQDIDQGYGIGDPLCDAWVAVAQHLPAQGMRLFGQALEHGIDQVNDAPAELRALFAQVEQIPDWVDHDLLYVGSKTLARYTLLQSLMLQSVSLMAGYAVPALAQPLIDTGALTDSVVPRMARTLMFAASVTSRYGLERGQAGFKQAVHVRMVHALVRHQLRHKPSWDQATYGVPINQSDLVMTNLQFSLVVLYGLRAFGCKLTAQERYAVLHVWRYIGYLMGLDAARMPITEPECNRWLYAYLSTQRMNSAMARPLAQALHELPIMLAGAAPAAQHSARLEQQVRAAITRLFAGHTLCDGLGLPRATLLTPVLMGTAGSQFVLDRLRDVPPFDRLIQQATLRYRNLIKQQYVKAAPALGASFSQLERSIQTDHPPSNAA